MSKKTYKYDGKTFRIVSQKTLPLTSCGECYFNSNEGCSEMLDNCSDGKIYEEVLFAANTESKETNPKDAVGVRKAPMSVVPSAVVMEMGLGMMEGARKYGRHNYRKAGVRASVYYDAAQRHLMDWWEGTDIDEASGLSHVTKAMTALAVLRDAMMNDMWTDDRPPPMKNKQWLVEMNTKAGSIIDQYPNALAPFTKENV